MSQIVAIQYLYKKLKHDDSDDDRLIYKQINNIHSYGIKSNQEMKDIFNSEKAQQIYLLKDMVYFDE